MKNLLPFFQNEVMEAGADEAGRGCLAGPVVCAAVILPSNFKSPYLTDSKQVSKSRREELREIIEEGSIAWNVQFVHTDEIFRLNILKASLTGMYRASKLLSPFPSLVLIDGNKSFLLNDIENVPIIKGDEKYLHIAAASILAKTHRDEYMNKLHLEFPMYNWDKNKGYPTKDHREAIKLFGPCKHHRLGFRLLKAEQLSMTL
jgi:ribonuclease HII